MTGTHLHGEDEALVAIDQTVGILNVLRSLLVAAFQSGHVAQANDLSSDGLGEHDEFGEVVDVAVGHVHMDDR